MKQFIINFAWKRITKEPDVERTPPALLLGRNLGFHCCNVCSHASKSGV